MSDLQSPASDRAPIADTPARSDHAPIADTPARASVSTNVKGSCRRKPITRAGTTMTRARRRRPRAHWQGSPEPGSGLPVMRDVRLPQSQSLTPGCACHGRPRDLTASLTGRLSRRGIQVRLAGCCRSASRSLGPLASGPTGHMWRCRRVWRSARARRRGSQ